MRFLHLPMIHMQLICIQYQEKGTQSNYKIKQDKNEESWPFRVNLDPSMILNFHKICHSIILKNGLDFSDYRPQLLDSVDTTWKCRKNQRFYHQQLLTFKQEATFHLQTTFAQEAYHKEQRAQQSSNQQFLNDSCDGERRLMKENHSSVKWAQEVFW